MQKRSVRKSRTSLLGESEPNWKTGTGTFTFNNGDVYEGEYKFNPGKVIVRQGHGTYKTDDFNVYTGSWDKDVYSDDVFHVRNGEEYKGKIDVNGMNGSGLYKFPDGSSIEALWSENRPIENIVYREQSGFPWMVENMSENLITFTPTNYFWNEQFISRSNESAERESITVSGYDDYWN